ncbi:Zinc finger C2H2-type [Sesbania bispinosa]|nr:Zinc finger C2H2-type [Sesbania bispinosa]
MLEVCFSLKRTLQCKSNPKQVHDPKTSRHKKSNQRTKGIDISNPISHEIVLDSSNNETCRCPQSSSSSKDSEGSHRTRRPATPSRITNPIDYNEANVSSDTKMWIEMDSDDPSSSICRKCGEKLKNLDAVEAHHISEHSEHAKTLSCFEEYREMVKIKADKLQKKHPRCLVDGNELLRFHGTGIACSLGINSSYSLCTLDYCGVCQILRHGFSTNKEFQGTLGVYTTSTSGKAFDSIRPSDSDERTFARKSVIVCRVIAGRVYCPLEENQEKVDSGFDSLAEKTSNHSDVEELYVLNPKALLPCFVVIYKQQTEKIKRFNSSLRISNF